MKSGLAAFLAAALLPAVAIAQTPTSTADIAPRTELHAIPTMTVSDSDFLAGKDGKAVTVAGQLRVAQGTGKLPVVILMHGSGGMGAQLDTWSRLFNAMGVSTFAIDGFTGRGLTSVNTNQAELGRLNFILDIYGALGVLAKHPRVDPQRIVLMGFSRGGQAALYASLTRFHKMWNKSGASFAAYIPFYPDCATSYIDDTDVAAAPIRIFHGIADDYNPVSTCKAFLAPPEERRPRRRAHRIRRRPARLRHAARTAGGGRQGRADGARLHHQGRPGRRAGQHRDRRALRLHRCLRAARPACRPQRRRGHGRAGCGRRLRAHAVQAEVAEREGLT